MDLTLEMKNKESKKNSPLLCSRLGRISSEGLVILAFSVPPFMKKNWLEKKTYTRRRRREKSTEMRCRRQRKRMKMAGDGASNSEKKQWTTSDAAKVAKARREGDEKVRVSRPPNEADGHFCKKV